MKLNEDQLAEKLIIRARNYWAGKNYNLVNEAQKNLIRNFSQMFKSEDFKNQIRDSKLSNYKIRRSLIKSAKFAVGKMIVDLAKN